MAVLSIICGVLLILCGAYSFFTPLTTFIDFTYILVILTAVYGVVGVITSIVKKRFGLGFAFSILSLVFGGALLVFPMLMAITVRTLLYVAAVWLVIMGVVSIVDAIAMKKAQSSLWVFRLLFGILSIIIGVYTCFHPVVWAFSYGWLIAFWLIESGFTMILAASDSN